MNKFLHLIFVLFFTVGCAALGPALSKIDTALTDTDQVLKIVETAFDAYQTLHPVSPQDRAEYDRLLATAYQDLNTGERAVADAKQLNQGQYDQAFADFKTAYANLAAYLKAHGVTPVGAGLVGAGTPGGADFPTPRVIGLRLAS